MKQIVLFSIDLKTEKRKLKQREESIKWRVELPYLCSNNTKKVFVGFGRTEKEAIVSVYDNALWEQRRLYNLYVTDMQINQYTLKFDNSCVG
jgi:hypothetical protein